jgi:hypothetical protein
VYATIICLVNLKQVLFCLKIESFTETTMPSTTDGLCLAPSKDAEGRWCYPVVSLKVSIRLLYCSIWGRKVWIMIFKNIRLNFVFLLLFLSLGFSKAIRPGNHLVSFALEYPQSRAFAIYSSPFSFQLRISSSSALSGVSFATAWLIGSLLPHRPHLPMKTAPILH